MKPVKIGMIGAGRFAGWVHYPSLAEIEGCEIVAVCDLDRERLDARADEYGINGRFIDYREMIDSCALDAVYVLMLPHLLDEPVTFSLSRGLHVFVEKPPGATSARLRRWADLAERHGCQTMVGFNRRFAPLLVEARAAAERSGPLSYAMAEYSKNFLGLERLPYPTDTPHATLLHDAIHAVDFLVWLGGDVLEVRSFVRERAWAGNNGFYALIRFRSGMQGILMSDFSAGARIEQYEMHGHGVSVLIDPPYDAAVHTKDGEALIRTSELTSMKDEVVRACMLKGDGVTHRIYGYLQENRHFVESIRTGRPPATNFCEALKTMELVESLTA